MDLYNGRCLLLGIAVQFLATVNVVYARPASNRNAFPSSLVQYMERYGYLSSSGGSASVQSGSSLELASIQSRSSVESALRRLQRFNGLEVTGVLDAATEKLLARQRCGMTDFPTEQDLNKMKKLRRRRGGNSRSLLQRLKRYAFHSKKWTSKEISFRIDNAALSLTMSEVRPVIVKALRTWEKVSGLRFVEKSPTESATIEISFQRTNHGDGYPFRDLIVLAHAFLPDTPSIAGDIHFNDGLTWSKLSHNSPENGSPIVWFLIMYRYALRTGVTLEIEA
uniref:Peptidase metallopeptidase domain-containing protein n=1 Tax=Plectus sambesii TaxID=2011161 RepID=A0A914UN41_9BILA